MLSLRAFAHRLALSSAIRRMSDPIRSATVTFQHVRVEGAQVQGEVIHAWALQRHLHGRRLVAIGAPDDPEGLRIESHTRCCHRARGSFTSKGARRELGVGAEL